MGKRCCLMNEYWDNDLDKCVSVDESRVKGCLVYYSGGHCSYCDEGYDLHNGKCCKEGYYNGK